MGKVQEILIGHRTFAVDIDWKRWEEERCNQLRCQKFDAWSEKWITVYQLKNSRLWPDAPYAAGLACHCSRANIRYYLLKPSGWRKHARTYRRGDRHVSIKNEPWINFLRSHLSECEYPACSHAYHRKWRTGLTGERFNRINTYYVMEKINEHRSEAVSYRQRQKSADR